MSREYGKPINREMLEKWGFENFTYDEKNDKWIIDRYWYKGNSTTKTHKIISVQKAVCRHKYTSDKYYPIVTFSHSGRSVSYPLSRVIYAWFKGPIGAKEVIDHIDNNPFNNRPENLQKLNVGENLAKRFIDNANCNVNQYSTVSYQKLINNKELYDLVNKLKAAGEPYYRAQEEVLKYIKDIEEEK